MKHAKKMFLLMLLVSLGVFLSGEFSQTNASMVPSDIVRNIASQNKESVVEIEVTVTYPSGNKETQGASGFFIDKEGYILTAAHVAYDDEDIKIEDPTNLEPDSTVGKKNKIYAYWVIIGENKYRAHFVGSNRYVDVALLKLENPSAVKFTPVRLGNSNAVRVGDNVIAIGSPHGLTNTVTAGIVSALNRSDQDALWFIESFIQTDAPINPGNSGSPLFNEAGEVIGINDAGIAGDGLGFAVPINYATEYMDRMKKEGDLKIGYFGAKTLPKNFPRTGGFEDLKPFNELLGWDDVTSLLALSEVSRANSAIVTFVQKDSPAENAGLKMGDVIVEFNGHAVSKTHDLRIALLKTKPEKEVQMKIVRITKGQRELMVLSITLAGAKLPEKERLKPHH